MTIQVRFYGDLREKVASDPPTSGGSIVINLESSEIENVADILDKYAIEKEETSHIFVNHSYAGFSKKIHDGDRVAIFAKNQALLYKWYFHREEDNE